MARYAAFISYSSRYKAWVATLRDNLELCLPHHGEKRGVFLDQTDLGVGRSWVTGLQAGIDQADQLVLVVTPEAMASPRVKNEWEAFVARERNWEGRLQVVMLVDTTLAPFLEPVQYVDFREHDEKTYRKALAELVAAILGKPDRRLLRGLAADVRIPDLPEVPVPPTLRRELVGWLATRLGEKTLRPTVAAALGLHWRDFDGYPSIDCAAAAGIVLATGEDDPVTAALRIVESLLEFFEDDESLTRLRERLAELQERRGESGLLGGWLKKVVQDHERLVPYFQQRTELTLLDRVYVQLQLSAEHIRRRQDEGVQRAHGPWSLRDLLLLNPEDEPWVTRRWVVLGDPGSGKTTLLRHLAASVARQEPSPWVPVFESLPRLMREKEWLLKRIERQMKKAGEPAGGLTAVLDREGQEGRLLLLLDGLDEVPREDREETVSLLRQLASRWPASPLVVTSRPIGYERPDADFQELQLLPFDGERRREFLARWFGRESGQPDRKRAEREAPALEENAGLRDLASNPLYLTLMALLIEQGTSPNRQRTGLYDQVFKLLLDGGHKYPRAEPMEAQDAVRGTLRYLALEMTRENRDAEPVTALEARLYKPEADDLREPLERLPRWRRSMRPFLADLAERTGILGPHDGRDADWRYWHRTFREALASEALANTRTRDGEKAILEHACQIAEDDLSRWAEPYALLAGRVEDPDALVRTLVRENRELGLRAAATAQGLRDETLFEVLQLSSKWQEREKVYRRLPEILGDSVRALALIDQLRQRTRNGNDLFFLERTMMEAIDKGPDAREVAERMLERFYDHIPAPPKELFQWIETPNDERVELWRPIPAGKFLMGSPPEEEERYDDEGPQHEAVIKSSFRMAAVPVTVEQYKAFDPEHRSEFDQPGHPVDSITWYQAYAFCRWLSAALRETRGARLPTEEEWEYACRAGTQTRFWSGDQEADLERVGWYRKNSEGRTHRVAEKEANAWGLYDVHGNVWEWTLSPRADDYTDRKDGTKADPAKISEEGFALGAADFAAALREMRVFRGGGFRVEARYVRSAYRYWDGPSFVGRLQGFRVCLPATPPSDL